MTGEASDIKEVQMDAPHESGGKTRRRRRARRAKTQRGGDDMGEGLSSVSVEKAYNTTPSAPNPVLVPTPNPVPVPVQKGGKIKPNVAKQLASPVVVLSPAKKKAKIMLVSKKIVTSTVVPPKTFKAKRIRVMIDNTARTQKRRRQVLRSVDSLTEEQLREQSVKFGLSRTDSVKKVPLDLLRKMLKDYYAMRKGFI